MVEQIIGYVLLVSLVAITTYQGYRLVTERRRMLRELKEQERRMHNDWAQFTEAIEQRVNDQPTRQP